MEKEFDIEQILQAFDSEIGKRHNLDGAELVAYINKMREEDLPGYMEWFCDFIQFNFNAVDVDDDGNRVYIQTTKTLEL